MRHTPQLILSLHVRNGVVELYSSAATPDQDPVSVEFTVDQKTAHRLIIGLSRVHGYPSPEEIRAAAAQGDSAFRVLFVERRPLGTAKTLVRIR